MNNLIIKGGRIIDPANNFDSIGDILVTNGVIKTIGTEISAGPGSEIIDASGKVVCPGFIDLHCHLRQPGYEAKETIAYGLADEILQKVPQPVAVDRPKEQKQS